MVGAHGIMISTASYTALPQPSWLRGARRCRDGAGVMGPLAVGPMGPLDGPNFRCPVFLPHVKNNYIRSILHVHLHRRRTKHVRIVYQAFAST